MAAVPWVGFEAMHACGSGEEIAHVVISVGRNGAVFAAALRLNFSTTADLVIGEADRAPAESCPGRGVAALSASAAETRAASAAAPVILFRCTLVPLSLH